MSATVFEVVTEDFVGELGAIRTLVMTFDGPGKAAKARLAAANSATLLLAATFEEYVREMAREHARIVVMRSTAANLPRKLAAMAWRRTMESLARVGLDVDQSARDRLMVDTHARFSAVYEFVKGDLSKEIYKDLIHNENNMRPNELNSMFKIAGLSDVCKMVCDQSPLQAHFGETDAGKVHGKLISAIEDFFERRNGIAHSLKSSHSSGPEQIVTDIQMLEAFSAALVSKLNTSSS